MMSSIPFSNVQIKDFQSIEVTLSSSRLKSYPCISFPERFLSPYDPVVLLAPKSSLFFCYSGGSSFAFPTVVASRAKVMGRGFGGCFGFTFSSIRFTSFGTFKPLLSNLSRKAETLPSIFCCFLKTNFSTLFNLVYIVY